MTVNKVILIENIVNVLADVQTVILAEHLDEPVRSHAVGRQSIEVEMRDTGLEATAFKVVPQFLLVPALWASPFLHQAFAVGFNIGTRLVVVGFQEEWDPKDRESYRARCIGIGLTQNVLNCIIQMFLANETCWLW